MLSTGPHTWTISAFVCVPQHAARCASEDMERTELCFVVVGLLAYVYVWSLYPNNVVKNNNNNGGSHKCDMNQMEKHLLT